MLGFLNLTRNECRAPGIISEKNRIQKVNDFLNFETVFLNTKIGIVKRKLLEWFTTEILFEFFFSSKKYIRRQYKKNLII
jgi:hypothetical protein